MRLIALAAVVAACTTSDPGPHPTECDLTGDAPANRTYDTSEWACDGGCEHLAEVSDINAIGLESDQVTLYIGDETEVADRGPLQICASSDFDGSHSIPGGVEVEDAQLCETECGISAELEAGGDVYWSWVVPREAE